MSAIEKTGDGTVYEVFARFKEEEPLRHIGSVVCDDPELARIYARKVYDEWSWIEMILAPRCRIIHIQEAG